MFGFGAQIRSIFILMQCYWMVKQHSSNNFLHISKVPESLVPYTNKWIKSNPNCQPGNCETIPQHFRSSLSANNRYPPSIIVIAVTLIYLLGPIMGAHNAAPYRRQFICKRTVCAVQQKGYCSSQMFQMAPFLSVGARQTVAARSHAHIHTNWVKQPNRLFWH